MCNLPLHEDADLSSHIDMVVSKHAETVPAGQGVSASPTDLETLRNDDAGGGEHGPPRVQQLVGAVLLHRRLILAQAQRVIPVAARTR